MTVRLYQSTDVGAPVQTGLSHSIISVLDKVLVTGYGATAPAGWTKPFDNAVDAAVFRQGALGARNRSCLRILENFHGFDGDLAVLTGYESMSGLATGTNPFPVSVDAAMLVAQAGNGDTYPNPIPWLCVADGRSFIYCNRPFQFSGATQAYWNAAYFGDFIPYDTTDLYCQCLIAGSGPGTLLYLGTAGHATTDMIVAVDRFYALCRSAAGGGAIETSVGHTAVSMTGDTAKWAAPNVGVLARPNAADGLVYLAPILLGETGATGLPRGLLRGVFHWCHTYASAVDQETYVGHDALANRTFLNLKGFGDLSSNLLSAVLPLEVSNTWDT